MRRRWFNRSNMNTGSTFGTNDARLRFSRPVTAAETPLATGRFSFKDGGNII